VLIIILASVKAWSEGLIQNYVLDALRLPG